MHSKNADGFIENNSFLVNGDLTLFNVMSIYKKSLPYLKESANLCFDFSRLNSSDSAGLALIIEWIKCAKNENKSIQFLCISKDIMNIAKAAGIDGLINS